MLVDLDKNSNKYSYLLLNNNTYAKIKTEKPNWNQDTIDNFLNAMCSKLEMQNTLGYLMNQSDYTAIITLIRMFEKTECRNCQLPLLRSSERADLN